MLEQLGHVDRPLALGVRRKPGRNHLAQACSLEDSLLAAILGAGGRPAQVIADGPFRHPQHSADLTMALAFLCQDLYRHDLLLAQPPRHPSSPPSGWCPEGGSTPIREDTLWWES